MIALKIIASGSPYFAVAVRTAQSSMSTELPLKSGARFVRSGSGMQTPAPVLAEPFAPFVPLAEPFAPSVAVDEAPPTPSPPPQPAAKKLAPSAKAKNRVAILGMSGESMAPAYPPGCMPSSGWRGPQLFQNRPTRWDLDPFSRPIWTGGRRFGNSAGRVLPPPNPRMGGRHGQYHPQTGHRACARLE